MTGTTSPTLPLSCTFTVGELPAHVEMDLVEMPKGQFAGIEILLIEVKK
jgi:hypothetical protein